MSQVFISHAEEDIDVALEIALGVEAAGFATWCYEIDSIPGPSYLIQTGQAVEECICVILIISSHSLSSYQVTKEVIRAHESDKQFIPVLRDVTQVEYRARQPEWREAVGAATSISIPSAGIAEIVPRLIEGLRALGINPSTAPNTAKIARIHELLKGLGEAVPETVVQPSSPVTAPELKPELESRFTETPSSKGTVTAKRRIWTRPLPIVAGIVIAIAVIVIAVVFLSGGSGNNGESVTIQDSNLDLAIREAIGKSVSKNIYVSDLAEITNLSAKDKGIIDLAGLEYCTNLTDLDLSRNQLTDISELSNFTSLSNLDLSGNRISDITALSDLASLTTLHLSENRISNISGLSTLTYLNNLDLSENKISDISGISDLINLTSLRLSGNRLINISPVSNLTHLNDLDLSANQINDIYPLLENSGMGEGNSVDLDGNPLNLASIHIHLPRLEQQTVETIWNPSDSMGEVLYVDDFNLTSPWYIATEADERDSIFFQDGWFHVREEAYGTFLPLPTAWANQGLTDFVLEVETKLIDGSESHHASIGLRGTECGGYVCCYRIEIYFNGSFSMSKWTDDGNAVWLKGQLPSGHINTGQNATNIIRIECVENTVSILANGHLLTRVVDDSFTWGDVYLSAGALELEGVSGYVEVAFDNIVIAY